MQRSNVVAREPGNGPSRHAWIIILTIGIFNLVVGLYLSVGGLLADPSIYPAITGRTPEELAASDPQQAALTAFAARIAGFHLVGFAVLTVAVAYKGLRRGERWAWYVSWIVPAFFVIHIPLFLSVGVQSGAILVVLLTLVSAIGLLWPWRRFFPVG